MIVARPGVEPPWRIEDAREVRFRAVDPRIAGALPRWIATGEVDAGQALRPRRMWRVGDDVLKLHGRERWMRRSRALRAALAAERGRKCKELAPHARFAQPRLVLEWGSRLRVESSLLVTEFIEGATLFEVWNREPAAVEALATFLAALERARFDHGDFHPGNVLWDGERWALLDLESLREVVSPFHSARREEARFARTLRALDFDPRVAEVHERYSAELGRRDARARWSSIEARARSLPPIPPQQLAEIRELLRKDEHDAA